MKKKIKLNVFITNNLGVDPVMYVKYTRDPLIYLSGTIAKAVKFKGTKEFELREL